MGLKQNPGGTPTTTLQKFEKNPPRTTFWYCSVHFNKLPVIPYCFIPISHFVECFCNVTEYKTHILTFIKITYNGIIYLLCITAAVMGV